jgi:hypothetical protein
VLGRSVGGGFGCTLDVGQNVAFGWMWLGLGLLHDLATCWLAIVQAGPLIPTAHQMTGSQVTFLVC